MGSSRRVGPGKVHRPGGLSMKGLTMRRLSLLAPGAVLASLLIAAPVAATVPETTNRPDPYVNVWCDTDATNADGTGAGSITPGDASAEGGFEDDALAKRVDARAIQPEKDPGGKDTATDRYNATAGALQGYFCGEA